MNALARARRAFLFGSLLGSCLPLAQADVTTQQRISIDGLGGMQIANLTGTTTTIISGERSRTETDMQMQSKLLRMLAHGAAGPRVEIVRLDLGKIDHLNVAKKEYTETSFAQMREQMQHLAASANGASGAGAEQNPTPGIDDSRCTWSDPKAEVKRTGETVNIAGYDAERLSLKASQACTDKQTGQVCAFVLTLDEWLAPKFQSSGEALKYQRAYAEQLGLGTATTSRDIAERAQAMFGRYKGIWSELASKSAEMKGYPMKTTFSFAVGGPQCQNAQNAQNGQAANAPPPSSNDTSADQNASAPPPTSPSEAAAQIGNKLAGFFKKSSSSAPADSSSQNSGAAAGTPAAAPAAPAADGLIPIITMSSELISVSTAAVDPGVFEIPADFKKVDR